MIKQRHVAAVLAEFVGTLTLVLIVLSVSLYRFPFFTALAAGVAVAVFVSAFAKIGAGHLNPIVSITMFLMRQVSLIKAASFVVVQVLAGFASIEIYKFLTERDVTNVTQAGVDWKIAAAEFAGAIVFGAAVTATVTQKLQGYQQAYTIGAGLFLGLTVASLASPAFLNPAVALGSSNFEWVEFVAAPLLGFVVISLAFVLLSVPLTKSKSAKVSVTAKAVDSDEEVSTVASEAPAVPVAPSKVTAKKSTTKKTTAKKSSAKKKPATKKKSTSKK